MITVLEEESNNPDSYADFLPEEWYHHSDKGCEIEMIVVKSGRDGEKKIPVLIKRCLTHGVDCHASGQEIGWIGKSFIHKGYCEECGLEIEKGKTFCPDCLNKRFKESQKKYRSKNLDKIRESRKEKRHEKYAKNQPKNNDTKKDL